MDPLWRGLPVPGGQGGDLLQFKADRGIGRIEADKSYGGRSAGFDFGLNRTASPSARPQATKLALRKEETP